MVTEVKCATKDKDRMALEDTFEEEGIVDEEEENNDNGGSDDGNSNGGNPPPEETPPLEENPPPTEGDEGSSEDLEEGNQDSFDKQESPPNEVEELPNGDN